MGAEMKRIMPPVMTEAEVQKLVARAIMAEHAEKYPGSFWEEWAEKHADKWLTTTRMKSL